MSQLLGITNGGGGGSGQQVISITTTDDTPTNIYSFTLPENSAVDLEVQMIAARSDYAVGLSGTINIGAMRDTGATVIISASQDNILTSTATPATVTGKIDGNNVVIEVTGFSGETWNWRAIVTRNSFTI